ncbi:MAG: type II toxin-antitoxin system PemK/MazF family toxin [Gemmataceae bacterium]
MDQPRPAVRPRTGRAPAGAGAVSRVVKRAGRAGSFCPVTSHAKGYPFEVPLPAGLAASGVVLADHVKCLDWRSRRAEYAGEAPEAVVSEVVRRLGLLLGSDGRG